MKLKYIVPDMAQTFGNLEFAGENDVEQQRVNGRFVPVTRSYNLYSDIQRADDIIVVLGRFFTLCMYHAGDPIGYADLNNSYWQQHLIGAGRIKQ